MLMRSVASISALAIILAVPACAEALSEQDARKIAENWNNEFYAIAHKKDAAGIANMYTADAVQIRPDGIFSGRAEIEKLKAGDYTSGSDDSGEIQRVKAYDDGSVLLVGLYTFSMGSKKIHGYWANVLVQDAGSWKARLEVDNEIPPKEEKK
jgi:ketosteroid isomerase-like protein